MEREPDIVGPSSHFYVSQRLRLHYLDWGNRDRPPLILIHGSRDHAHSWDWVARELRRDYHVVVPDLRGHGDSAWAIGGMYTLSEFVLDIAQLLEGIGEFPVTMVAHSLGGAVSLHYAGTYSERVARLVAIEGLGPPPDLLKELRGVAPAERMRNWISKMQEFAGRQPRRYRTIEDAMDRMQEANSFLSEEQARHLTIHGVSRNEDGTYSWKFDNYVRALPPYHWDEEDLQTIWGGIRCPTLLIRGTESWASDPCEDGRGSAFQNARFVNVEGAGHWVHHDRLDEFLRLVREFVGSPPL